MSDEFKREEPYIVFKVSDLGNSLKGDEIRKLAREYAEHRKQLGKKPLECVVVEKDWPEYEPTWRAIEASVTGAQPALSLASDDVSLISEGKTQPAQSVKDAIIDDLQSQFDTEGITEHDSGDALIRLSDAIAAVEDSFVQIAPSVPSGLHPLKMIASAPKPGASVPEDVMRDAERYRYLRARDDGTAGVGCWIEADGRVCDRGWLYGVQLDSAIDSFIEVLAAAPKPEAKP